MIWLGTFLTLLFLFSLISERAKSTIITGPMVFSGAGILAYYALPEITNLEISDPSVLVLVTGEITLAVLLFADATHTSLREVVRESQLPARLLGIGMPLTILTGTLAALLLVSDAPLWQAAILATILAPTDASLGASVVKSRLVPHRIRQALEVESGLNDGLSMPLLVLFIALSGVELHGSEKAWLVFTAQQIGFGLLVGLGIGWLGGLLMTYSEGRSWLAEGAKQLSTLSLAVLSWWLAEHVLGGNGFIAAFVAGGTLRTSYEHSHRHMARFNEAWGDLLVYLVFFTFGLIAAPALESITGLIWLYALLSLTVVRMLPVALATMGGKLQPSSVLFLGWFGPRGLASVVLGMVYLEQVTEIGANSNIVLAVIATVLLSVLAHGVSANPAIGLYANALQAAELDPEAPEYTENRASP
jgi:NhaP-type Na+/H+ or K+/H+ antiporter